MKFNFEEFKSEVYAKFADQLDKEEIDKLLNIEDGYSKDTPISIGKNLFLTGVHFHGTKTNGEVVNFSQELYAGINIWIADNLKGKSSVFKIIQLALTGNNKLKHDIKKWLSHVLVTIRVGEKNYSIYLDLDSTVVEAKVFALKIASLAEAESEKSIPIIHESGLSRYEKAIENFFFKQFSYYSLRWTQKDSRKDKNALLEAGASWKTYFKSMFLESKDSNIPYGSQEKKILEMLMGLELTYPINRLTIRKDFLKFEKAKKNTLNEEKEKLEISQIKRLEAMRFDLERQISQYDSSMNMRIDLGGLYEEYDSVVNQINRENSVYIAIQDQLRLKNENLYQIRSQIDSLHYERLKVQKECTKIIRKISDIKEYVDVGMFFSNLDIKFCPSCNKEVYKHSKSIEDKNLECNLCHESIDESEDLLDQDVYVNQIEEYKAVKEKLELEANKTIVKISEFNGILKKETESINKLEKDLSQMLDLMPLKRRLRELEAMINGERQKLGSPDQEKYRLISEKAVIEFQIEQSLQKKSFNPNENYDKEIQLLSFAINLLKEKRYLIGDHILESFTALMLSQLNEFGLSSITDIEISQNFDIRYKQDGEFVSFENIAEGEQLRAKIAFYLSLIQLDIEQNFGKHTRFLIIDSPGKEEGDRRYLEGLSTVLQIIEAKFGKDLQILIGTAERNLSNIVEHERITPEDAFLF